MPDLSRRQLAAGGLSALAFTSSALARGQDVSGAPFSRQTVLDAARTLASSAYTAPATAPQGLTNLDYSTYRAIRYRPAAAVWGQAPTRFSIQMFAPGSIYAQPVDVMVVESGMARPAPFDADRFDTPSPEISRLLSQIGRFAGFRLHYPINRDDLAEEFLAFQGASYFRAVSRDQTYGLSARGLALGVGEPDGEEFPVFRRFWIERPSAGATSMVVHALLDSPSVTGAYRFGIYPGVRTAMEVSATLFPRVALDHVGLGCLTSMFMHGPIDPPDRPDFRPSVHDSLGLAIHTGTGERIWRPLSNPGALQFSAFVDRSPRGFGLAQRARSFEAFEDLEARYETRPSAWVEPDGDWGEGHVQLVEIPSDHEGNDNIVAYWRPATALPAGQPLEFGYLLTWPDNLQAGAGMAQVLRSAAGVTLGERRPQIVIDYSNPRRLPAEAVTLDFSPSGEGGIEAHVGPNAVTGGLRVYLTLRSRNTTPIEVRVRPRVGEEAIGETWLYRWVPRV